MSYIIVDRDALRMLDRVETTIDATILEATKYRDITTIRCNTESRATWSKLDRMEALMLYRNMTGMVRNMMDYPTVLDDLAAIAKALPETTIEPSPLPPGEEEYVIPVSSPPKTAPQAPRSHPKPESKPNPKPPSVKGSTGRVWEIADEVYGGFPETPIKELRGLVIAACIEAGIHPATAATQWSKWKKAKQL